MCVTRKKYEKLEIMLVSDAEKKHAVIPGPQLFNINPTHHR